MHRARLRSGQVILSTLFLGIAATGTSACSSSQDDEPPTFYCTDANETIVDESYCDDDNTGLYFLAFAALYGRGLRLGSKLPPGGSRFLASDKAARASWGLPATGRVSNGTTVKTGVVGTSGHSTGGSGTSSGS